MNEILLVTGGEYSPLPVPDPWTLLVGGALVGGFTSIILDPTPHILLASITGAATGATLFATFAIASTMHAMGSSIIQKFK